MTTKTSTDDTIKLKKSEIIRKRIDSLTTSFKDLKTNPLDLNKMMAHIGLLSFMLDEVLTEYVTFLEKVENMDIK